MSSTGSTKKINLLHYPVFSEYTHLTAFTTTRQGGVSEGDYHSLNLSEYSGDLPTAVEANRALLCRKIGLTTAGLFIPYQTHDNRVLSIDESFLTLNESAQRSAMQGIDALITNRPGVCIGVTTADCVPVLLFDPVHRVAAAIHAGWRGTVKRIASKTLQEMTLRYQTNPADVVAAIGPSIGPEAYEVGEEVAEAFHNAVFSSAVLTTSNKPHIDLWQANRQDLMEAGLQSYHIEISGICTFTHHEQYFSARRLGIRSGRIVTGIMLK